MLDITKQVWKMLINEKSTDEILKICSISSLCKIRAEFNKQKESGTLSSEPLRFPQKPRGKKLKKKSFKVSDKDFNSFIDACDNPKKPNSELINANTPPSNYPKAGKPDIKLEENFEKGEKSYTIKSYEINTLEDLIKWTKVDMTKFDCASFIANRWGNERWECTQCKATFKPKIKSILSPEECANIFKKMTKSFSPRKIIMPRGIAKNNIAVIPVSDLHFGSISIKNETREDNNLKLCRENAIRSMAFHLQQVENNYPSKIVLTILGDFFNVDTVTNTTTAGTYQEQASTIKNTYREGCKLLIELIEMCLEVTDVHVIVCEGNHDQLLSVTMTEFIGAWYRNSENVTVDDSFTSRKYYKYGNTLLGFSHGLEKANSDYLAIMMESEHFKDADFREFMIGHLHSKTVIEKPGVTVRRVGSLNTANNWEARMGYKSLRSSESYIVDKKSGIISNSTFYLR